MVVNLTNAVVVKLIADREEKQIEPGSLIAAAMLPGIAGIAFSLIGLQQKPGMGNFGHKRLTMVPDAVASGSVDAAKTAITDNKLKAKVVTVYHETIDKDEIVDQDPKAGINVPVGSNVTIYVSLGPDQGAALGISDHGEVEKLINSLRQDVDNRLDKLDGTLKKMAESAASPAAQNKKVAT